MYSKYNAAMLKIVVTGASRGIGWSTALEFARAGYEVVATMRDPAGCPEISNLIPQERLRLTVETMDVDSDESVKRAFDKILTTGPVDVLVNNAGVERMGTIEETPLADFKTCMETNYFGVIRCTKSVVRQMRERGRGAIINISSLAGKISPSPMGPYSASKFALEALSEALAQELQAFGVRVAIVQPGIIDTRMARNIGGIGESPTYPQVRRIAAMFEATISAGAGQSSDVAQKIREIVESDTVQLRHPVGPDAVPFLGWRSSMNDESWIQWGGQSDSEWLKALKADFGMDLTLE